MLFNSYEFIYAFFPIVFSTYWGAVRLGYLLPRVILCFSSLIFYSFMALEYAPLILLSILTNYTIGACVCKSNQKNLWLLLGIIFNLSLIFFYKYFDLFFYHTLHLTDDLCNNVIPLGISFYTFTQIAYLHDAYHGRLASDRSFISYFLFVTYFPHLIAGPILHHREMIAQFFDRTRYFINYKNIFQGLCFFIMGLSKKVLIADSLIPYVNPVFKAAAAGEHLYPLECWCGALAYTFQLYFDFSGYSDMAIGLSGFFNFNLPFNFNSPYKAKNIIDFWRRWHISLSSFLKNYLYIPLGGNRKGTWRRYINLLITMVLGGAWHGANWTFIVWGAYHGTLLAFNHIFFSSKLEYGSLKILRLPITFFFVVIGWIIFRSENITAAINYYSYLIDFQNYLVLPEGWKGISLNLPFPLPTREMQYFLGKTEILTLFMLGILCFHGPNSQEITSRILLLQKKAHLFIIFVIVIVLFITCLYKIDNASNFIYFQF